MWAKATIVVKYLPPTDHKPARLKASCQAGSKTYPYSWGCTEDDAYWDAAKKLMDDLQIYWGNIFVFGRLDESRVAFTPITSVNVAEVGVRNA